MESLQECIQSTQTDDCNEKAMNLVLNTVHRMHFLLRLATQAYIIIKVFGKHQVFKCVSSCALYSDVGI